MTGGYTPSGVEAVCEPAVFHQAVFDGAAAAAGRVENPKIAAPARQVTAPARSAHLARIGRLWSIALVMMLPFLGLARCPVGGFPLAGAAL